MIEENTVALEERAKANIKELEDKKISDVINDGHSKTIELLVDAETILGQEEIRDDQSRDNVQAEQENEELEK